MNGLLFKQRRLIVCALLALVTLAVFWQVHLNGFIEYDDDVYISENPEVLAGWTGHGVVWAFMGVHCTNWHPLTWISHMTDCQFFGANPGAHHLVNVAFHCANAALLLWLLDLLTGKILAEWGGSRLVLRLDPLRGGIGRHWAAERKDVLCAFFFLLTR